MVKTSTNIALETHLMKRIIIITIYACLPRKRITQRISSRSQEGPATCSQEEGNVAAAAAAAATLCVIQIESFAG